MASHQPVETKKDAQNSRRRRREEGGGANQIEELPRVEGSVLDGPPGRKMPILMCGFENSARRHLVLAG
jgi:hypothetical protein